jgi:mono/diheme cytochrome c family protein
LRTEALAVAALAALALAGCRQGMFDQAKKEAYEASDFFADGTSARPLPANTVARGQLREDRGYYFGMDDAGTLVAEPPIAVDRALLERGRERYEAFCSMCHDRAGTGNGMVVQRGFPPAASYHQERLRAMPAGYFVNVMTAGFGRMPSYASQIPPADRWAIAVYVKVLQAAHGTALDALPPEARAAAEAALAGAGEGGASGESAGGHGATGGPGGAGPAETGPPGEAPAAAGGGPRAETR